MANIQRRKSDAGALARRDTGWNPFAGFQDLMRWDPFREFGFPFAPQQEAGSFAPDFDVKETKDSYVFKADLPGVKESDMEISLDGNRLSVSGKREEENREESDRYFACERSYGNFSRTFTLPGDVDEDRVQADLKEGVLTVTVPRAPGAQTKKIEIKKGGLKGKVEA